MTVKQDWRPTASIENIQHRARVLAEIRAFFSERGVMEVETPILSRAAATAPYLDSFVTRYQGPYAPAGEPLYLQTSPEFAMKRLLAAGSGPIYQICKAFRNGEAGRFHNPEFTMLEWYRPDFDHHALMDEVEALVCTILGKLDVERLTYRELFLGYAKLDPFVPDVDLARDCLAGHGIIPPQLDESDWDGWLNLLLSLIIEPELANTGAVFVYDFPASQAMLAKIRKKAPFLAERFELYVCGVELANGFHELADAREQKQRFERDNKDRLQLGLATMPVDKALLAALDAGFPQCAGVALGLDRLMMLATKAASLEDVITLPISIA